MSASRFLTRRAVLAAACLTGALALTACGASSPGSLSSAPLSVAPESSFGPAANGPHNAADIAFATDMIPHHTQAVVMAVMALSTSKNAQVLALAKQIQGGQDPEITTMKGWLRGWAVPAAGSGHDMSSMATASPAPHGSGMAGMMNDQQMQSLSAATGTAFDRLWITMMSEHHNGAIEMSRTELAQGQNPDAKALAQQIIKAQTSELSTMASLRTTLG